MKKIVIFLFVLIIAKFSLFSQQAPLGCDYYNQLCDEIGMFPMETDFIELKVNDNPLTFCRVKICYCYLCIIYPPKDDNTFKFSITNIIYSDSSCLDRTKINWDIFKISIVKELAIIHQESCNIYDCDDPLHPLSENVEIITAQCYLNFWCYNNGQVSGGYGMMLKCGNGYCAQKYYVCYNNGNLLVTQIGEPVNWGSCEGVPTLPLGCNGGEIVDPCYSICY